MRAIISQSRAITAGEDGMFKTGEFTFEISPVFSCIIMGINTY